MKVLVQAAHAQKGKEGRPRAVRLLEDALLFEPLHLEAILQLAPLLIRVQRPADARALLETALTFTTGRDVRRLRKKLFALFPGFKTLWRWLRA